MEQLAKDKDYSKYLLRLVELKSKMCNSKEELEKYIAQISKSINSAEVINYVRINNLFFDYNAYVAGTQNILTYYNQFVPLNKVDVNKVGDELIKKINFLIKNPNVNFNDFEVNVANGDVRNLKDKKIYDVRKNPNTAQFELYAKDSDVKTTDLPVEEEVNKSKEVSSTNISLSAYTNDELREILQNKGVDPKVRDGIFNELNNRRMEQSAKTNSINNPRVKVLTPDLKNGYVSSILLTLLSATFGVIIAIILVMNK